MPQTDAIGQDTDRFARLARLTGLPDLRTVCNLPDRLETLIPHCANLAGCLEPGTPIRYRIAYEQYAELATRLYENPEDHDEILVAQM